MRASTSTLTFALAVAELLVSGCLPTDTRPAPAKVLLDVDLAADLRAAQADPEVITFQTDEGWTVTFEQLMVSLGEVEVYQDVDCSEYGDAPYFRLLDLKQPGPQRLGQIWGLQECRIDFSAAVPTVDAVLGEGVTVEDRTFLHTALVPISSADGLKTAQGMAAHVRGSLTRDAVSVTFDWGFSDRLDFTQCQRTIDGMPENGLPLASGDMLTVGIAVDPRKLFNVNMKSLAQLVVDADQQQGDANGVVSVSELFATAVPDNGLNLAELMRQAGYPGMFVYSDGMQCRINDPEEED